MCLASETKEHKNKQKKKEGNKDLAKDKSWEGKSWDSYIVAVSCYITFQGLFKCSCRLLCKNWLWGAPQGQRDLS